MVHNGGFKPRSPTIDEATMLYENGMLVPPDTCLLGVGQQQHRQP
jgi:hypothetical protein